MLKKEGQMKNCTPEKTNERVEIRTTESRSNNYLIVLILFILLAIIIGGVASF